MGLSMVCVKLLFNLKKHHAIREGVYVLSSILFTVDKNSKFYHDRGGIEGQFLVRINNLIFLLN